MWYNRDNESEFVEARKQEKTMNNVLNLCSDIIQAPNNFPLNYLSEFERFILLSILDEKNKASIEESFNAQFRSYICDSINHVSYYNPGHLLSHSNLRIADVRSFLGYDSDMIYKICFEPDFTGVEFASLFRLIDYFKSSYFPDIKRCVFREIRELIKGIPSSPQPFFYLCRSSSFVDEASLRIVTGLLDAFVDDDDDDEGHDCWEHFEERKIRGKTITVKAYDNIQFASSYLFIWLRLKHRLDSTKSEYLTYEKVANRAEKLLLDQRLADGSWPWNSSSTIGDVETTYMATHALFLSDNKKHMTVINESAEWLYERMARKAEQEEFGGVANDICCIDAIRMGNRQNEYISFLRKEKAEDKKMGNKIFIVHGHDTEAKITVARTIEKLGLEAIILHEQADNGKSIIEKLETASADATYAVVLYTECDVGRSKKQDESKNRYRARQNVVFEHGLFIGCLGRNRVSALVKGNIEKPGDVDGVVYIPMDEAGAWQMQLCRNMKAVGIEVDLNKLY